MALYIPPTLEQYAPELAPFYAAGWHLEFRGPEDGFACRLYGRLPNKQPQQQFYFQYSREETSQPVLFRLHLLRAWEEVQRADWASTLARPGEWV